MKKILSVVLSLILALSCFAVCGGAVPDKAEDYPVIMIPGYSTSSLVLTEEDGTQRQIWGLDFDAVIAKVLTHLAELLAGLGLSVTGIDSDYIADMLGTEILNFCGELACNPDGTSKYNVKTLFANTAEACNSQNIYDVYQSETQYQAESDITRDFMELIGGRKNLYYYLCDFRMGSVENARKLRTFIEDVLAYSGAEKVNIIAVSHGGQVTAAYLNLYAENTLVNNAVMTVPAIGGAALALDVLTNTVDFDEETLLYFIENGLMLEEDFHVLVQAEQLGFLDDIIRGVVPYLWEVLGYWTSIWDFIPLEDFENVRESVPLKPEEPLLNATKAMHELMANMTERLQTAQKYGTHISIIAGTGTRAVTGLQRNSDGIITVNDSTGATCAPWGLRFADGYTQKTEDGHNHVSPSMEIDASTCYLPDNTWFVDGLFHGMTYWDDYSRELMYKLLLTQDLQDVYSDPDYPQFHAATNACYSVHGAFDVSSDGYLSGQDGSFTVTNLSDSHKMRITGIYTDNLPVEIEKPGKQILEPGESITVSVTKTGTWTAASKGSVTITYRMYGAVSSLGERVLDFTVTDGERATAYSEENLFALADETSLTERAFGKDGYNFLRRLGLQHIIEVLLQAFRKFI